MVGIFSYFFLPLIDMEIKNLKIRKEFHKLLKDYCKENGLVMSRFLEKLIKEKCSKKKDIYGE
jgi:hypothetical protein